MSPNQQFILELVKTILKDGKGFFILLSSFGVGGAVGWHIPQPSWAKKKIEAKEEG